MPEPNDQHDKPIERLLRSYKRERTKQDPLPLHPATRSVFQREVERAYPPKPRDFRQFFRVFWPQLAFGSGLCAILLIAVLSLRVRQPGSANREPKRESEQKSMAAPASEPAAVRQTTPETRVEEQTARLQEQPALKQVQETELLARDKEKDAADAKTERETTQRGIGQSTDLSVRGPQPTAQQPTREYKKDLSESDLNSVALQDQLKKRESVVKAQEESVTKPAEKAVALNRGAAPAAPASGALGVEKLAKANDLTNLGAAIRLRFVEVPDPARREAKSPILTSFQMEQSGNTLQFLDSDGSVYTGQLTTRQDPQAAASSLAAGRTLQPQAPAGTLSTENAATYSFVAQGTNRTLHVPVVLQGNFFERTSDVPSPENTFSFATDAARPVSAASTSTRANRSRHTITGKAIIARTNEVPIKAISADP